MWLEIAKASPSNGGVPSFILNKNPLGAQIERTTTLRVLQDTFGLESRKKNVILKQRWMDGSLFFSGTTALSQVPQSYQFSSLILTSDFKTFKINAVFD